MGKRILQRRRGKAGIQFRARTKGKIAPVRYPRIGPDSEGTATVTALSWHFREPRHFEGGNLVFSDLDDTILVENNMLIVFPSCLRHGVTQVKMKDGAEPWKGLGRYCLSSFMNIK